MLRPLPRSTLFPTRRSSDLEGSDDIVVLRLQVLGVSIRAPVKGATHVSEFKLRTVFVSIRAPMKGATLSPRLPRSEEHTSELQSRENLVCRLLLEKKKKKNK